MDIRPTAKIAQPAPATIGEATPHAADPAVAAKSAAVPVETAAAVEQPARVPSSSELASALKNINQKMQSQNLEFSVDPDSDQTIIKVVDRTTKEVLRQIPSEDMLEISKALDFAQKGLLIKQQA